jgi:hypothetical protein
MLRLRVNYDKKLNTVHKHKSFVSPVHFDGLRSIFSKNSEMVLTKRFVFMPRISSLFNTLQHQISKDSTLLVEATTTMTTNLLLNKTHG